MSKNALIVWGGLGRPSAQGRCRGFSSRFSADGFSVEVSDTLDSFRDESALMKRDLIVPIWTMGKIDVEPDVRLQRRCKALAWPVVMAACATPFAIPPNGNS